MQRVAGRGRLAEKAPPVVTALLFNIKQEQLSLKKVKVKMETKKLFLELILKSENQIAC